MNAPANRMYSVVSLKSINEEQRIIQGRATSPTTDHAGDVVMPKGGIFELPLPLLMDHGRGSDASVGHVIRADVSEAGIDITAQFVKGEHLENVDRAWAKVKNGLVKGLSIGFKPVDFEPNKNGKGFLFRTWKWIELSACVIPMNETCTIQTIKSYDLARRAAPPTPPAAVSELSLLDDEFDAARLRCDPEAMVAIIKNRSYLEAAQAAALASIPKGTDPAVSASIAMTVAAAKMNLKLFATHTVRRKLSDARIDKLQQQVSALAKQIAAIERRH